MSYGFIYMLDNPSMPGLVKIGFTHKHPLARMEELTKATSCPSPFRMLAYFDTATPREVERAIHQDLDEYRTNPCREFFNVPLMNLQEVVLEWCDLNAGICSFERLDFLAEEEGRAEAEALGRMLEEARNGARA